MIPFSLIYSFVIYLRNKFYDAGIFKSFKISKPVVSIGNITAGGTGKTPLTIFIAEYFLRKGKTTGIISRGYNRKSNDFCLVSDGNCINDNVEQSGDELILISKQLIKNFKGKFFIAAGRDRIASSDYLIYKFNPDVIILDDAFQHRKIKRDIDIVLIDSEDFNMNKFPDHLSLPSGKMRESISGLRRADLIIQNNKASELRMNSKLESYKKELISMRYKTEYFMDNKNCILQKENYDAIVFSGIANDESFIKMINISGINIDEVVKFSDHYNYKKKDIECLKGKYSDNKIFITTEKDFVKIKKFEDFVSDYPVYYLKMKIEINDNKNILTGKLDELLK